MEKKPENIFWNEINITTVETTTHNYRYVITNRQWNTI